MTVKIGLHVSRIIPFIVLGLLFSCNQKKEDKHDSGSTLPFENARDAFFSSLQDPSVLATELGASAVAFDGTLLSNPQNLPSYANDPVKAAVNLGVYLSDLNYCVAYHRSDQTHELFAATHELSKAIGIEQKILDYLMKRYDANIRQNDSIQSVLNELFDASTTDLRGTERERFSALIMAGYQVENLHLLLAMLASVPQGQPTGTSKQLYQALLRQRGAVQIMYTFLKSTADPLDPDRNPNYLYYTNAFEELIGTYGMLTPGGDTAKLREKVEVIRKKILSTSP